MIRFIIKLILALLAESLCEKLRGRGPVAKNKPFVYMAPVGTPLPDLSGSPWPKGWKKNTARGLVSP